MNDDGITSAALEFTEWSHRLKDLQKASGNGALVASEFKPCH